VSGTADSEKLANHQKSILLVDDDPAMRSLVSDELRDEGFHVVQAADGREALYALGHVTPTVIITDLRMPFGGMELVAQIKSRVPQTPIILMTAFGDAQTEAQAYKQGATAYFNKPVRMEALKTAIRRILLDGRA
jgi:DNA-binding NtrC family response regulator